MNLLAVAVLPMGLGVAEYSRGELATLQTFTLTRSRFKALRVVDTTIDDLVRSLQPEALAISAPTRRGYSEALVNEQRISGVVLATFLAHYSQGTIVEIDTRAARAAITGESMPPDEALIAAVKRQVDERGFADACPIDLASALAYAVGVVAHEHFLHEVMR